MKILSLAIALLLLAFSPRWQGSANSQNWQNPARGDSGPDSSAVRIQELTSALRSNPGAWEVHLELGEIYYRLENLPAARHHLERALRSVPSGPDSLRAAFLDARVLLDLGLKFRAMRILQAIATKPDAPPEISHDLSLLLRADRFPVHALMAELRAVEQSGGDPTYLREAAQQWKELGRSDAGIRVLEVLTAHPEATAEDFFQLGLLAHRAEQTDLARSSYEHALERKPDDPEAHYNLALILEKAGEPDKAAYHLERVLRLRPHYEPAYFQLGLLFLGQNRRSEAQDVFQRYLLAGQDSLALSEARDLLRSLSRSAPDSPELR